MKKLLLEALLAIKEQPLAETIGICGNVTAYAKEQFKHPHDCMLIGAKHDEMLFLVRKLIAKWPDRCDSIDVPVEGNIIAYLDDSKFNRLWENPRRRALLDWMIKELENGTQ